MKPKRLNLRAVLATLALGISSVAAQLPRENVIDVPALDDGLCVSNLFQSNMVLQRDKPAAVWGWAAPGEKVSVAFAGQARDTTAAADRSWKVVFDPMTASREPKSMTINGEKETLTLDNILLGDVWVLGGQSNMEFELAKVENGQLEIVSANFPEIRILTVPYEEGLEMGRSFPRLHEWSGWFGRHFRKGDWDVCTPEVARDLSAIGYVFARRIHKASGVPIGVIDASRGGTTIETWTPLPVLRAMDSDSVKAKLAEWDQKVAEWDPRKDLENRVARHRQFVERMEKEGKPVPADRVEPTDLLPGPIADHNHPGACYAGMISPLAGFAVKGAIFHQGYNNAFEGMPGVAMYADVFPAMIESWRKAFGDPAMPFGILSLCTDGYPQTRDDYVEKMHNTGIYIRAAQYRTFLDLYQAGDKNIGFASTYDLRRRWYHPQLKLPAGERIARWALATQYGFERQIEWKPPFITAMQTGGGRIVLEFDGDVGDPEDGAMEGFAISGNDGRFQPADAEYLEEGKDDRGRPRHNRKKLVLSSPLVPEPVHYRYAWGRNPLANVQLTGNKDIPLATQRSDSWSMHEIPFGVLGDETPDPKSRPQQNKIRQALRLEDMRRRIAEAELLLKENQELLKNR